MPSPTTRVLAVLELLQARGALSGPELAERIGVDARTLRRYIRKLEDLGIPVVAERGRYGAYRLMPGFKLPPMVFTDDEALALSVGLLAARGLGLAEAAPATESARAKLERVMPAPLQRRVRALGETVQLDIARPGAPASREALLTLSAAAHARQSVHMDYRSARGEATARAFDPYGLAWRGGHWYAVGHCHLRGGLRSFRLDRIASLRPLPASFGVPEDFDAVRHLALGLASLPRALAVRVLLHTDLATAREALFDAIGLFQPHPGGVLLHSQVDDLAWYARQLARLPCAFTVLEPPALRDAVREHARALLRCAQNHAPGHGELLSI
ncbi:MAG: YafY family protein [Acidovorax sp.]|uniref:helix-turn-helix transcriptional regulator n=1 Tax=Acidovorax sp. TaxID=1872122 RepID=UPI0039E3F0F8